VSANSSSRIIRFSAFEVNLDTGELRQRGQKVKLQEQPFQVLAALLERPGDVVTREELRRKLWPADTFVDFDHSLNAAIKRLRDALGESAERPVFIETMAKRGYRFICPSNMDPIIQAPHSSLALPIRSLSRRHVLFLGGILFVTLSLVLGLNWERLSGTRTDAREKPITSLAVLPLENLSRDSQQEYFSDGMTEALTDDLSKITTLRVVSHRSAVRYKATRKTLAEIARELNVDGVIEGSVQRSGNRVRIRTELLDARRDQHLWGQTYERELGDVLMLQNDVAQAIAERIHARLAPQQQSRVRSRPGVNPEAYEDYLKGRFYGADVTGTRAALKQAQGYYEDAIRKDPTFALAYVGLADCFLVLGANRLLPPKDAYQQGGEAVRRALQLEIGRAHV